MLLIRALEDAGRRAEALEAYAQARQVIADELGVDPGAELQRLYAELLAADASPPPAAAAPGAAPVPDASATRRRRRRGGAPRRPRRAGTRRPRQRGR